MTPPLDVAQADRVVDDALAHGTFFTAGQRRNIKLKARDLAEERTVWESVPFRLQFEPNRRCNVKCLHCDIERGASGELDLALIERALDQIGWGCTEILPYVGGDPTLAELDRIAPLARRHGAWLTLTTNGHLFTRRMHESVADVTARLCFSSHTHDADVFKRVMPSLDYDTVVQNVADAAELARVHDTDVVTALVVLDSNLETLDEYVRFVHRLGVRRIVFQRLFPESKVFPVEGVDGAGSRLPPETVRAHLRRALDAAIELGVFVETNVAAIHGDPRNVQRRRTRFDVLNETSALVDLYCPRFCRQTATTLLVEWDGTVLPCCRDHIVLGNLHEQSLPEIWNGAAMQELRRSFYVPRWRPHCARCFEFCNGKP
jgi:radical SAM protein with 4Fe4S-binding SPASM domain